MALRRKVKKTQPAITTVTSIAPSMSGNERPDCWFLARCACTPLVEPSFNAMVQCGCGQERRRGQRQAFADSEMYTGFISVKRRYRPVHQVHA